MFDDFDIFRRGIRRTRRAALVLAAFLVVLGGAAIASAFSNHGVDDRAFRCGFVSAALGLLVIVSQLIRSIEKHPGIVALRDHAETITWVYVVEGNRSGARVRLCFDSGKTIDLPLFVAADGDEAMRIVMETAPWALRGYDEDLEWRFENNPYGLRLAA